MSLSESALLAPTERELVRLLEQLDELLEHLAEAEAEWSEWLTRCPRTTAAAPRT